MARTVGFFHSGSQGTFQRDFQSFADDMNKVARQKDLNVMPRFASDERSKSTDQHLNELVAEKPVVLVVAGGPRAAQDAQKAIAGTSVQVVFTQRLGPGEARTGQKSPQAGDEHDRDLRSDVGVGHSEAAVAARIVVEEWSEDWRVEQRPAPASQRSVRSAPAEAARLNVTLVPADVTNVGEIETAIKTFKNSTDGMLVTADSLFNNLRQDVVKFADGMKAIYQWREFAEVGGYMSFGPSITEAYRQVGDYAARISERRERLGPAGPDADPV